MLLSVTSPKAMLIDHIIFEVQIYTFLNYEGGQDNNYYKVMTVATSKREMFRKEPSGDFVFITSSFLL